MIIPARNAAATIERTLDCLVSQSDTDWEAIVINDGSSDGTNEVVSGYAARHRRIRTLTGLGQGVSAARNAGLAVARGRRILFLDADDWVSPDFLERMNGALDGSPAAVVAYCAWHRVTPDGRLTPPNSDPSVAVAPLERFARSCAVTIHSVLADHSLIRRVGGFDTSLRTCEDWDFWQRLSRLGGEWVHVDRAMSYYRISPNSLTQNVSQMKADARVVITRGFAADSRVSGAPEAFLKGALPGDEYGPQTSYGYFALWCSAFDVGRGLPAAVDSDVLDILTPATSRATDIAKIVLDGVMVGLQSDIEGMTENWSAFAPRLRKLFGLLASSDPAPGSRRKLQYALEILLLKYGALNEPRALDLTLGLQIDLRAPPTTVPSQGIDRLHARLRAGKRVLKILDLGIVGTMSPRDWRDIASRELRDRDLLRIATPASVRLLFARRITGAAKMLARRFGRGAGRIERLHEWSEKPRPGSHAEKVRGLLVAEGRAAAHQPAGVTSSPSVRHGTQRARYSDRQEFFEQIFENTDPWDYGSSYEQEKYGFQIDLLPEGEQVAGMELACAEGLFTQMVAPRFRSFLATDISETALARAKVRCASLEQVSFQVLDLATGLLPTELDVIFCSEVLYYLRDEEELVSVTKRLASALRPGGVIITAHAHLLKDSPDRTGFDWEHPYGAKTISAIFAATEGLALESSIETELYRIDRLRRIEEGAARTEPKSQKRAIAAALAPEVARQVVYGGVEARRADLTYAERPTQIPVLMYHSIAEEGPTALARYRTRPKCFDSQLGWLRRNGYHAIGSEELLWFIENRHPFYGRPVLITFDDAFQDFADTAWPLLRRHDFFAEVFVVTDLVGEAARWDDVYGPPAPLMDSDTIAHLHAEGARFGSHLATHSGADGLATLDLIGELARSRAAISGWLERPVQSLAAPYGLSDDRLRRLAREAGFRICFGGREGFTSLTDDPLDLPRIEVRGEWSLPDFKNAIVRHTGEQ